MSDRAARHSQAGGSESIFSVMTRLAVQHDAVNLGQGFPSEDGPEAMLRLAMHQIAGGRNQYAPSRGLPELREAIAGDRQIRYGQHFDPESEVLVTVGATEAIACTLLAFAEPGSEVLTLEPFYDSYAGVVEIAGAKLVPVPLVLRDGDDGAVRWCFDAEELAARVTPNSRVLIVNTPHNPTGLTLGPAQLRQIGEIAERHNLVVLADEVYETLVYEGKHVPVASEPLLTERTVTVSSAAKRLSVTGWKTGWALGPAALIARVHEVKQFLTFAGVTPVQPAIAYALTHETAWQETLRERMRARRDRLHAGLAAAGFKVLPAAAGYFLTADAAAIGHADAAALCTGALLGVGVAAIPVSAFVAGDCAPQLASLVRFAFCKGDDEIAAAVSRLGAFSSSR